MIYRAWEDVIDSRLVSEDGGECSFGRGTEQFVLCFVGGFAVAVARVERVLVPDVENFLESLLDEDEGDQGGKVLLGEAGDVTDEGAGVCRHQDKHQNQYPHADAEAERQILPALPPVKDRKTYVAVHTFDIMWCYICQPHKCHNIKKFREFALGI